MRHGASPGGTTVESLRRDHGRRTQPYHVGVAPGPRANPAYALCILVGIVAAALIMERRLRAGRLGGTSPDIAIRTVPAGIVGARADHLAASP
jgi:prolipoprotein diacylglyceryltransferase